MEIFFGLRERQVFGPPSQLPKCHNYLKENVPEYNHRIEETAVLVQLAYKFMMDRNRRQWHYLHGLKHFDDVDDHRPCTESEERRLGPWIRDYMAMVAVEFRDNPRIVLQAKDILLSLFEFRDQQWHEMLPDDEQEEDATAGALEDDWDFCSV